MITFYFVDDKTNRLYRLQQIFMILCLCCYALFFTTESKAESLGLFEMTLDELLHLKVTTPSKSLQTLSDTPGIITTYSAQEILLFGGTDLGEVLSRLPGFEEFPSLINGRNIVTIRADQPIINNNHVLFLLNGVPLNRESYTGGIWNEAILTTIPLDSIQQLEVIRGPGSPLYGTNAFAGVVNIMTKSAMQLKNQLTVGVGKYGSETIKMNLAGTFDRWQWTTAMSWHQTDGWPFKMNGVSGNQFEDDVFSASPGVIATLANGAFSANAFWGKSKQFTIRGTPDEPEAGKTENEKYLLGVNYEIRLTPDWSLKTHLSYVGGRTDHNVSSAVPGQLLAIEYKTDDSRLELTGSRVFDDDSSLLLGASIDYFTGSTPPPIVILDNWHNYLLGFYGQYEVYLADTKLILGAQYNKAQHSYHSLVPRFGLIHHFNEVFGVKFLYARAFRSPYEIERKINITIPTLSLKGDENLKPEYVTTWDLQLFYAVSHWNFSGTLFRNEQEDLITREKIGPRELRFANKGELTIEGIELEGKYTHENWFFSGSITAQQNEDGQGQEDYTLQPDYIVKLGLGYAGSLWSLGIFDTYTAKHQDNIIHKPNRQLSNPQAKGHHNISANITFHPIKAADWQFKLYLDNLTNEDVFLPIPADDPTAMNTRPVLSGRRLMFSLHKFY